MRRAVHLAALAVASSCALACGGPNLPGSDEAPPVLPTPDEVRADLTGLGFTEFLDRSFVHLLRRTPETVIDLGLDLPIGRSFIDDVSDEFLAQTRAIEGVALELLRRYDRAALTASERVAFDAYGWWLDDRVRDHAFEALHYRLSPTLVSVHQGTELFFTDVHPVRDEEEARNFVARLARVARKFEQAEGTIRRQETLEIVLPRRLLEITRSQLQRVVSATPRSTPYYLALQEKLEQAAIGPSARSELLDDAARVIETSVQPAYRGLESLLASQYSNAPAEVGVWQHPNGEAFYAHVLRHHVTTAATADELHQLGLDELSRIHAELETRFDALGYPSSETIEQRLNRARQDGGFVPSGEVVKTYETIIAETQARLPEAFDLLPSAQVVIRGVRSGGFYVGPSLDGSRPGAFFATVGGAGEARFGMRTLAYHEAIPGHHLQIGIAQDLPLPLFQRVVGFTGFVEGWALYAEWLASDLGWYAGDPYGDIGRLQAEAFRAARLVVDTGIHAKRWTADQASAFFQQNVGFGSGASFGQIVRYASWPGQSTAYMTGSLKIRALRARAEAAAGGALDVKTFHRAVLSHGSLPLEVMERVAAGELQLP